MFMNVLARIKKYLILVIINLIQNIMMIETIQWLVRRKIKKSSVVTEEFVELKPMVHSSLVDDSNERKKTKGVNKSIVATVSHKNSKMFC